MLGDVPPQDEMLNAALSAYRLRLRDVEPLLSWAATLRLESAATVRFKSPIMLEKTEGARGRIGGITPYPHQQSVVA